jgi:hypothetical protein
MDLHEDNARNYGKVPSLAGLSVRKSSKLDSGVPDIKRTGLDCLIETGWRSNEIEVHS